MDICYNDLNGGEIIGTFDEKELQKTNQHEFRIEKVIKKKGRPFQERRAIARTPAHTRAKVFRRVINCTRKYNLTTRFYFIIACV